MPGLRTEEFVGDDRRWLASTHALANARTSTLDVASFTRGTHYPDGYIPSGTPLDCQDEGTVGPYTGAAGERLGFLATAQPVGDRTQVQAPVVRHGLIHADRLPQPFEIPAEGVPNFTFIGGTVATPPEGA